MKFALVCTMYERWQKVSLRQNWVKLFSTKEAAEAFAMELVKQVSPECTTLEEFQDTLSTADYFHVMDIV